MYVLLLLLSLLKREMLLRCCVEMGCSS